MSLVLSTELADPSYRNAKLYTLKGTDVTLTPDLSSHNFAPDKHRSMYMTTESYSSESYEKYFLDSPTGELVEPSSSSISGVSVILSNPFDSSIWSTRDAYRSNSEDGSPDGLDFDGEMRLKLQELERALFSNDEEEEEGVFETVQSMEIDPPGMNKWANPSSTSARVKDKIEYISGRQPSSSELAFEVELGPNTHSKLLRDSPKESSSSDSSSDLSSISSTITKDAPQTPKQLLYECARVLSEGNENEAVSMINKLRQMVSIQGDPSQRIAAYMVEGLAARLATSGKCIYKALRCKEPPSNDRLAAMQILFEICPCFKFGYIAANGAIAEAVRDEKKVHIVDFDICQGTQYIALIQTLASMSGRPHRVRLTAVDDPESIQRSVGGIRVIGQRLEKLAEELGLPFEFRAVASSTSIVTPSMLNCREEAEEVLVVNFAFQLHHMRDETVSTVNERDQLLRMVKSLNPKLVTVVEQDMNTNTSPFLQRFVEAYNYYSAVFDTLDATLPRESQDRMNVERQCLAKDIVNIVACEGEERIERYEVAGKWRARLSMAGFSPSPMSTNVREAIRKLIVKQYCERFKVKEEMGGLHFGWEDKNLVVASAWK